MKKIPSIELGRLPNADYLRLMNNLKEIIERIGAEKLGVSAFFEQYVALISEAAAVMESEKSSSFTPAMNDADLHRDDDYRVFYYYIKSFTFSRDAEMRDAAWQVMRVVRDGDNPLKARRNEETTLLENLYNKLLPERYVGYLDKLQARVLLNTAVASNNEYKKLSAERVVEQGNKASGSVKVVRGQLDPVYANIISGTNGLALLNPGSPVYEEFTKLAAAEVKHFKDIIYQRKGMRNSEK